MPSKPKKHLKSKLSQLDHQTTELSASSSSPNPHAELSEEELLSTIEAASRKYPDLIGTSAFIGRVVDGDPQSVGSKGFTIWLSESSMLASSISPGSTVSVSLASSRKGFSCNFPLSSLSDECARHFGFAYLENMVDEVGNYFALATVFPSCKVLQNEVRLSSNLSYSMGCPSSDRIVFVYLINSQSAVGLVNGISKLHMVNCLPEYRCTELYLSIVSQSRGFTVNSNLSSQIDIPAKTNHGQLNEKVSSPKTPSFSHSKLSSSSNSQLSEKRCVESGSNVANTFRPSFGLFDINEVLGDESGKKLLQTCLASWLVTHTLLCGNLVIIPILSMVCIFQVIKARRISESSNIKDLVDKRCSDLYLQALDLVNNMSDAYFVDHETKIYFHSPLDSASVTPQERDLQYHAHEGEDVTAKKGVNISKLGGLSKEFGVLKDIIISSAAKGTLSSLGLRPTKGVLLHGPAGTGKTSLARLCAHDAGVNLLCVNGPEVVSQYYGESELALQKVFNSACQTAPAVVFIDELDAIAPARKDGSDELSQRMIAALLNLMDGITRTDGILVIAVTNRPDSIEPALRRPGRLDREVTVAYNKDPSPLKLNLGVGAYRTEDGKPLILNVVRKAEQLLVNDRSRVKEYLPIVGLADFNKLSAELIFGSDSPAILENRVTTVQCLSGTGSLRVGAEFLARHYHHHNIYIPQPTWGNHPKVFALAGLSVKTYRYYDPATRGLDFQGLLQDLRSAPAGAIVLLHACAHNPTGVDPTPQQWEQIRQLMRTKGLLPFFDSAYQGFASGNLDADALSVRMFVADGGECLVAQSYAKNMGLYGERVGALSIVCRANDVASRVESQLKLVIRPMYSNPPIHGASIVVTILKDRNMYEEWTIELKAMADRIISMRQQLYDALCKKGTPGDWSHIVKQIGMFTFTGLNSEQVAFITKEFHVYMTFDGRISMAGLSSKTVPHLTDAIHAAVTRAI